MEKVKKLFGEVKMTWLKVIVFAVTAGVVTGLLNVIPALDDTSFQDIAISFECWILFALFIILNCDKWWEASLKCFVFFLISQPLVYLVEVPFNSMGWELFSYYGYWFKLTVLTLPGAAIAFLVKRKDWLSVLVLSVATCFLAYLSVRYLKAAINIFPHHLLSAVFCLCLAVFCVLVMLEGKREKLAALGIIAAAVIVSAVLVFGGQSGATCALFLEDGNWVGEAEDSGIVEVTVTDGKVAQLRSVKSGSTYVKFTNTDTGETAEFTVVVDRGTVTATPID